MKLCCTRAMLLARYKLKLYSFYLRVFTSKRYCSRQNALVKSTYISFWIVCCEFFGPKTPHWLSKNKYDVNITLLSLRGNGKNILLSTVCFKTWGIVQCAERHTVSRHFFGTKLKIGFDIFPFFEDSVFSMTVGFKPW